MEDDEKPKAMGQVIQIDEARIKDHLGEMVRGTVEEALNGMLDAEAGRSLRAYAAPLGPTVPAHSCATWPTVGPQVSS